MDNIEQQMAELATLTRLAHERNGELVELVKDQTAAISRLTGIVEQQAARLDALERQQ